MLKYIHQATTSRMKGLSDSLNLRRMNNSGGFHSVAGTALRVAIIFQLISGMAAAFDPWQIYLDSAAINGSPVKLLIDTGSPDNYLLPEAVKRLGPAVTVIPLKGPSNPPCAGRVDCTLTTAQTSEAQMLFVPIQRIATTGDGGDGEDGYLGWPFLRKRIFVIDAVTRKISFFESVPKTAKKWLKLHIHSEADILYVDTPDEGCCVLFDTGGPHGVYLQSKKWSAWKENNLRSPSTVLIDSFEATGKKVLIESWAHHLSIGPISISETPIVTWDALLEAPGSPPGVVAMLGMAAIRRLDLLVDGPANLIYLHQRTTPALPYEHNRAGLVFESSKLGGLWARVLPGTPAYEAGIRNGDRLIKAGGVRVDDLTVDLPFDLSFLERVNGRSFDLTLDRFGVEYQASFTLRDLLGADAPDSGGTEENKGSRMKR